MPQNTSTGSSQRAAHASNLSPRQKFQAHVRTLSDDSLSSRNAPSSRRSPELQHVSSLRVRPDDSPPPRNPARPSPVYRYNEADLRVSRDGQPAFIAEEREAWARPSPLRIRKRPSNDVYFLQPPEEESPARQPCKDTRELQPFAPSPDGVDENERPKTSRGPDPNRPSFDNYNSNGDQALTTRNSRFAEGSMNNRSAGISSTWNKHSSISSLSATESDGESTPRASPQRSSIDLDEFKPPAVTPATLKQRLLKIGSTFKHNEKSTKVEAQPQVEKKKKGLRKSISMWNIHNIADKRKTRAGDSTHDLDPKPSAPDVTAHHPDKEVLNDRKRRAEEAYAEQFSTKRRKSTGGQVNLPTEPVEPRPLPVPVPRSQSRTSGGSKRGRRVASVAISTDSEMSDERTDIDHHKRPSRRELEKENQKLREMLKHQQPGRKSDGGALVRTVSTSASIQQLAESDSTNDTQPQPRKVSSRKLDVPPIPPIPDRVALRTLSNTRNQPNKNKAITNASTTNTSANANANSNGDSEEDLKRPHLIIAGAAGLLPRPVSMILEEDEEAMENKAPTPSPSPKRRVLEPSSVERRKARDHIAMQIKGFKREQWEWPDDVF
ncbi:hypothetical protein LTS15_002481 [Exophiala xenobiotica]|nr:hypothetical protein LTS15_002481 [Exophiala xenobiotica]